MEDAAFAPDVEAHFRVFGNFDPDEVTRITGLTPSTVRHRGDQFGDSRGRAVEDTWRLVLGPEATLDGTQLIVRMLDVIEPESESLIRLRNEHKLLLRMTLVAYVPHHRAAAVPNVSLDLHLLERLVKAHVELDFDFMLLGEDAPESPPQT